MDTYIQSLEEALIKENDIKLKIDIMNNLSWELRRNDKEKSFDLCCQAYDLSLYEQYEKGIAESILCIAIYDTYNGNNMEAMENVNKAYDMFVTQNNINGKIKALNCIGFIYSALGKEDKALECYLRGLSFARSEDNGSMIIFFLNNIGELYNNYMNMYEEALKYYLEAFEYCKKNNSSNFGFVLNSIGNAYLKMENTEKALKYCEKGLNNALRIKDRITEAQCYKSLGKIYNKIGNDNMTLLNFGNSLIIYQEINSKSGECEVLTELGSFFINTKDYNLALDNLNNALTLAQEMKADSILINIYLNLASIYEKINEYEKSVTYYKKYMNINHEITTSVLEKKLNGLIVDSKTEQSKKNTEIYKLKNVELKEKSEEIENKAKLLEESYKNIAIISEIGQKITSSLDIETIMNTIYENMNVLMDATIFGIGLYDEITHIIDYKMFIDNSKRAPHFIASIDSESSCAARCILSKKEIVINDIPQDEFTIIHNDSENADEITPRSLIYYPLIIESKVIGTITVQSYKPNAYTPHNLDTMKALASYISIAINNSQKSEEIKRTAAELKNTLKNLQDTQEYLIQSEKMAALGQLISGIAHEINTPLGAIQASIKNILEYMEHTIGEKIPKLFKILSPSLQEVFTDMLRNSMKKDITISSRDERKYKKTLKRQLETWNLENPDGIADTLVDMGIYESVEGYSLILKDPECEFIIQTCYELSGILRNTKNMDLAIGKASKMLYALKSYSRYNHMEVPVETNITVGIDTILALYHNNIKQGTKLIKNYRSIPNIICYSDELNQVWTNLIHNALQAMEYKGTLQIDVYPDGDYVAVRITDSGVGIPSKIKEKIFEPFYTTKRQGEGSGLGLGIVKKIIDKHKGEIIVDSIPGKTSFTVRLPVNLEE